MRTLFYIAGKDLLLHWRDRLGFFWWMLGFPLLIAVLIGQIFSGVLEDPTQPLKVALVDKAGTPESRQFAKILEESGSVAARPMSEGEARDAVRTGGALGLVTLKADFRITPAVFSSSPAVFWCWCHNATAAGLSRPNSCSSSKGHIAPRPERARAPASTAEGDLRRRPGLGAEPHPADQLAALEQERKLARRQHQRPLARARPRGNELAFVQSLT